MRMSAMRFSDETGFFCLLPARLLAPLPGVDGRIVSDRTGQDRQTGQRRRIDPGGASHNL